MTFEEKKDEFIKLFKSIKTERKGRKAITKGLSTRSSNNLKKLIKRGFTQEEFTLAINEMFDSEYPVKNGLDVPDHILAEDNFERYLNRAVNKKIEADKIKEENVHKQQPVQVSQQDRDRMEREVFIQECKDKYTESLKVGEWIGIPPQAGAIGAYFKDVFTKEKKSEIYKQVSAGKNTEDPTIYRGVCWEFAHEILKLAVEQKIIEPWKQ